MIRLRAIHARVRIALDGGARTKFGNRTGGVAVVQSYLLVAMKTLGSAPANLVTENLKQKQFQFGNPGQASGQINRYLSSAIEGSSWEGRIR
jgi:hypothetical protein